MKLVNLSGRKFSTLTVLRRVEDKIYSSGKRAPFWECKCECGKITRMTLGELKTNKSCGCRKGSLISSANHGRVVLHGKSKTKEFWIWWSMLKRCGNKSEKAYKDYGGRGITVCERWHEFSNFYTDMGERPSPLHSLDRRDNDGPYSPDNCRWANRGEQSRNKRQTRWITIGSETLCLKDWAARLGISTGSFYYKLRKGMTEKDALGVSSC